MRDRNIPVAAGRATPLPVPWAAAETASKRVGDLRHVLDAVNQTGLCTGVVVFVAGFLLSVECLFCLFSGTNMVLSL